MLFAELVGVSRAVSGVAGRLDKTAHLADLLRRLEPGDLEFAASCLVGDTRPRVLGLGHAAIASAATPPPAETATLSLREVEAAFEHIAAVSGTGAVQARVSRLRDLLARATREEQEFLVRLLHGDLRQGALDGVLTEAVALAASVPAARVRRAVMMSGSLPEVARTALVEGDAGLARCTVQLLRPIRPMLADSAPSVEAALEGLGEAALEFKLDGARVQVHKLGEEVRVFSRHLRDVTPAVPEVVGVVRALPAASLILDGEVLALRPDGSPQPFQTTMRRVGRTRDIDALRAELPLTPFFFDALYRDGQVLLDDPQAQRFACLTDVVAAPLVVPSTRVSTPDAAARFLAEALARGHEGVMAKSVVAPYEAGSRGSAWLKVKAAHTLDLVVLAAEWGSGRRQGWLSNLHLGARDPAGGAFVMLGKTFKGLTDEVLAWQTRELLARELARDDYTVCVRPELVVEVAFNDIQVSPRYPGGLALRFARVKRYRTDKPASEADTFETVQALHARTMR